MTRLKVDLDAFDFFAMVRTMAGWAAFVSWADLIVRALRGEAVSDNRRTTWSTAFFLAATAAESAAEG